MNFTDWCAIILSYLSILSILLFVFQAGRLLRKRLREDEKLRKSIQEDVTLYFFYFPYQFIIPKAKLIMVNFYDYKGIERKMIKLSFYIPMIAIFLNFLVNFIYYNFCF